GLEGPDERKVPVQLGVVQAVADDELRRDLEARVPDVQRHLLYVGLLEQRADLQARGPARPEVLEEVREREAGVDDVLDHQDVAARDLVVEVLQDPYDAAGVRRGAVRGDGHEIELQWQADVARQVRHEHERALEDADEEQIPVRVVGGDLRADLGDLRLDRLGGDEDLL